MQFCHASHVVVGRRRECKHPGLRERAAPLLRDPLNAVRFILLAALSSYVHSRDLLGSAESDPRWELLELRRNGDRRGAFRPASYRAGAEATWCAIVSHLFADAGARLRALCPRSHWGSSTCCVPRSHDNTGKRYSPISVSPIR